MGTMQERLATSGSSSRTATKSSIELINTDIVTAQLLGIPAKIRETIERQAIHRANVSAVGTLRQNTPVETGALRKSFKYDIRKYKGGDVIVGLSGADYDYVGTVQRTRAARRFSNETRMRPTITAAVRQNTCTSWNWVRSSGLPGPARIAEA